MTASRTAALVRIATLVVASVVLGSAPILRAQASDTSGPTVLAARAAFFAPTGVLREPPIVRDTTASCGSALKNAVMLGLGFSLAAVMIEVTYTLIREPFVRGGHEISPADPVLIAWAGGAGFVVGLIGTELCRRRRR